MSDRDDLLNRALGLPESERAALARCLLLSLEAEEFDADSEPAWVAELEARLERVEKGLFTARDWRAAVADIRRSLA